jgi:protein TonB
VFPSGNGPAAPAPSDRGDAGRRLAVALSLSLLLHALLLWAEPARAPWGAAGAIGMALKARLVAVRQVESETLSAVFPVPEEALAAANRAPGAGIPPPAAAEQAMDRRAAPPAPPVQVAQAPSVPAAPEGEAAPASQPATPLSAQEPGAFQMPLPAPAEFLPARMLDVLPRPEQPVALVYPDAVGMGRNGLVTLLLLIDESGAVVEAKVVDSNPSGVFDAFAIDVFRATRFLPGQRDGRPVRSRLVVEMSFDANPYSRRAQ